MSIIKTVCQHCNRVTVVPGETIAATGLSPAPAELSVGHAEPFAWTWKHPDEHEKHRGYSRLHPGYLPDSPYEVTALYPTPAPVQDVRVKPLIWSNYEAQSPVGHYRVQRLDAKWEPLHNGSYMLPKRYGVVKAFDSVDEAKAYAQNDYETRIRSALASAEVEG